MSAQNLMKRTTIRAFDEIQYKEETIGYASNCREKDDSMVPFEAQWTPGPCGTTSDCYYGKRDDHVFLKLFHDGIPDGTIEREYSIAKHIHGAADIRVPNALELLEVGKRKGIIFERVFGKTFADLLKERSISLRDCAETFGRETLRLHGANMDTAWLPILRDEIEVSIDYVFSRRSTRRLFHRVLNAMYDASDQNVFLHGDLHPGNLMVSGDEFYWIDIGNACVGPALFDLAAADIMLNFPITYLFMKNPFGLSIKESRQLYSHFLETYFRTNDKKEIARWKKKIRLRSAFYTCDIVRKENWRGVEKFGIKLIILMICSQLKRCV